MTMSRGPSFFSLLFCAMHAGCSSDGAKNSRESGEVVKTTEALTLPPINAAADTSLRQQLQYANDGTGINLSVSDVAGAGQRSLIRFDQARNRRGRRNTVRLQR